MWGGVILGILHLVGSLFIPGKVKHGHLGYYCDHNIIFVLYIIVQGGYASRLHFKMLVGEINWYTRGRKNQIKNPTESQRTGN